MQMETQERHRQEDMQNENMNKQLDRENKIQLEVLKGIANEGSYDPDVDTTGLLTEQAKVSLEQSKHQFDQTTQKRALDQQDIKLDIEEKKADQALQIAKLRDKGTLKKTPKKK